MDIKVFNEDSIQKFKTEKKHIVISVQEPGRDFVILPANHNRIGWFGLWFFDLDKITGIENYDKHLFRAHDARAILDFVNYYKNNIELIVVNCVAGISRSAGIAGALSRILNDDDFYFFKYYCPNMRVYRFILEEYYETKKSNS